MKTYTVVGYYPDNGQSFLDHTEAMSPQDAVSKTLAQDDSCSLVISALFEGKSTCLLELTNDPIGVALQGNEGRNV